MNRYSTTPTYTVINNALIKQSLYQDYLLSNFDQSSSTNALLGIPSSDEINEKKLQEISHLKQQNIDFENDIFRINFSFKGLYKISNLEGFTKLTVLLLDNNNIQKIENISHLTNLKRLDLSFNKIQKIEGLEGLIHLENLSLFNNEISKIENMESLRNLKCLSIAKNQIHDKDIVYILRKNHPHLGMLTIFDNPVCQDRLFRYMALAFLDKLQFYDYRMIKDDERQNAIDKYNEKLIALTDQEDREKKKEKRSEVDFELNQRYKEANLNGILDLFSNMFDAIPKELNAFDYCTHEAKKNYQEAFEKTIKQLSDTMFEKMEEKRNERNELYQTMEVEKQTNDEDAKKRIKIFEKKKQSIFDKLKDGLSEDAAIESLDELQNDVENLISKLIAVEVDQHEAFVDIISQFKENYEVMDYREVISSYFKELRVQEDKFSQEMKEILLDQVSKKDNLEDEIKDQVGDFLEDKDQLIAILSRATETRVEILQQKEDELLECEKNGLLDTLANVKLEELQRNRSRISECIRYSDRIREEIIELKRRYDIDEGYESFEEESGEINDEEEDLEQYQD